MFVAIQQFKSVGQIIPARGLSAADREFDYACPECHTPVLLVLGEERQNHFRHVSAQPNCKYSAGLREPAPDAPILDETPLLRAARQDAKRYYARYMHTEANASALWEEAIWFAADAHDIDAQALFTYCAQALARERQEERREAPTTPSEPPLSEEQKRAEMAAWMAEQARERARREYERARARYDIFDHV